MRNNIFIELKRIKLEKTKLIIKPIEFLTRDILIIFNKYKLIINKNNFNIIFKVVKPFYKVLKVSIY